jgi:hypothetical protein
MGEDMGKGGVSNSESGSTGWFVGIVVAIALLAVAYLVFSANSQPSTTKPVAPASSSEVSTASSASAA